MRRRRILIVEDDDGLRHATHLHLTKSGYSTAMAAEASEALEILQHEPQDLVISDLNLPGMSGLELLKRIKARYPETEVVMITAFGTVPTAVEAIKSGAYDYLTKPIHLHELSAIVERVLERLFLIEEVRELRMAVDEKYGFDRIIGRSKALLFAVSQAVRVAPTDATILILGETGTGKEVLAKAIHFNSLRRDRPFVTINCAAIPKDLLESELFGHLRGSFTGAVTHKRGKVEMADRGTLFLDEIGELPMELQVRLLRLIQEREIEKIGATRPTKVDVRILAATNRNLESLVDRGTFREDLYYRLVVVPIVLPPLRKRVEDIPDFVQYFFETFRQKHNKAGLSFPPSLMPYFSAYSWPGNVRQLENAVERMVVLSTGNEITIDELPEFLRPAAPRQDERVDPSKTGEAVNLAVMEKELIVQALKKFNWNQTRAAQYLGLSRKTLMYRIAKYGIERDESKPPLQEEPTRDAVETAYAAILHVSVVAHFDIRREIVERFAGAKHLTGHRPIASAGSILQRWNTKMCDYSLMTFPNRLAREGEQLVVHQFPGGTKGLASPADLRPAPIPFPAQRTGFWSFLSSHRKSTLPKNKSVPAVCIPPGAHLLVWDLSQHLQEEIKVRGIEEVVFTQITAVPGSHRDALHFGNGRTILIQQLQVGQRVLVLGLSPAEVLSPSRDALAMAG